MRIRLFPTLNLETRTWHRKGKSTEEIIEFLRELRRPRVQNLQLVEKVLVLDHETVTIGKPSVHEQCHFYCAGLLHTITAYL